MKLICHLCDQRADPTKHAFESDGTKRFFCCDKHRRFFQEAVNKKKADGRKCAFCCKLISHTSYSIRTFHEDTVYFCNKEHMQSYREMFDE